MASLLSSLKSRLDQISGQDVSLSEDEGDMEAMNTADDTTDTTNTTSLIQIQEQGNRPEDWLSYIKMVKENISFPSELEKEKFLSTIYHRASKAISVQKGKNNGAYAQLLVDHAEHLSKKSPTEASNLFSQARYLAKKFAVVHVTAAQFEVSQGNTNKAVKILEKAKELQAEPMELVKKAFRNLHSSNPVLLSDEDKKIASNHMVECANSPGENKENPDLNLLQPRRSWICGNSDTKKDAKPSFQADTTSEVKGSRFYTDQISSTLPKPTIFDSDDSNTNPAKMKTPMPKGKRGEKDSTVSFSSVTKNSLGQADDNTMPCSAFDMGKGVYHRTALRSYNSTPDCKNPSVLSGRSSTKDSGRKARLVASNRPMRVKRTSLPQLSEGLEHNSNKEDKFKRSEVPLEEEPVPLDNYSMKDATSTIDLLRSQPSKERERTKTKEGTDQDVVEPMETTDQGQPYPPVDRELGLRKISTGSDSGILIQPMESGQSGDYTSGMQPSLANFTLQANTPSTQVAAMNSTVTAASQKRPLPTPSIAKPPLPPPAAAHPNKPSVPAPVPMAAQMAGGPIAVPGVHNPQQPQMMMPPPTLAPAQNLLYVNGKAYTIIRIVGRGGSSKVYECLTPDTQMSVAIKCVTLDNVDSTTISSYKNEIQLLKRLQYSHRVIKLIEFEHNQDTNILYVVMEKGDTDLATFFRQRHKTGGMSPQLLSFYWMEMLEAVQVLHKEGIVHSDLKPANFLLVAGNLKLIDFGIANAIQQDMTSVTLDQQVGTLNYMSPETIRDTCGSDGAHPGKPTIKIGVKSDVWSLGCILYNLVYGRTPFQHITNQICKLKAIMDDNVPINYPPIENNDLLDTLQKCLVREPKQRYSIEDLLKHPYCRK